MGVYKYISLYFLGKKKADREIFTKGNITVSVKAKLVTVWLSSYKLHPFLR